MHCMTLANGLSAIRAVHSGMFVRKPCSKHKLCAANGMILGAALTALGELAAIGYSVAGRSLPPQLRWSLLAANVFFGGSLVFAWKCFQGKTRFCAQAAVVAQAALCFTALSSPSFAKLGYLLVGAEVAFRFFNTFPRIYSQDDVYIISDYAGIVDKMYFKLFDTIKCMDTVAEVEGHYLHYYDYPGQATEIYGVAGTRVEKDGNLYRVSLYPHK